jgi:hypothetical protein
MADQSIRTYPFGWKAKVIRNETDRQDSRGENRRERPRKIDTREKEISRNES